MVTKTNINIMKLKEFSTVGGKALNSVATISFNKKGFIGISVTAAELIGIKKGDRIVFYQDEEHPEDWYFDISSEKGAILRNHTSGKGFACNYSIVAIEVLKSTKNKDIARFQISTEKENGIYAIITRNNLKSNR